MYAKKIPTFYGKTFLLHKNNIFFHNELSIFPFLTLGPNDHLVTLGPHEALASLSKHTLFTRTPLPLSLKNF